jgi:oligoribonuclease NrnB/cAMP/cGMP phosphodiesterase (DHH superfamily)
MHRVFYHRMDLDGLAAGAIARAGLERGGQAFRLYPYDYADPFPEGEIQDGDTVWFLDVAWQPFENMARLARERGCRVVSVDHHRSVAESGVLDAIESHFSRDGSASGCWLAWETFLPGRARPGWVELLSAYDVWKVADQRAWSRRIVPFQLGMQAVAPDPSEDHGFWAGLIGRDDAAAARFVNATIRAGRSIALWTAARNRRDASLYAFEARLDGLRALCINSTVFSSEALESAWDPALHDVMIVYARRADGTWRVGLFATDPRIDVSAIAGALGGGGHRGAAGLTARSVSVEGGRITIERL